MERAQLSVFQEHVVRPKFENPEIRQHLQNFSQSHLRLVQFVIRVFRIQIASARKSLRATADHLALASLNVGPNKINDPKSLLLRKTVESAHLELDCFIIRSDRKVLQVVPGLPYR